MACNPTPQLLMPGIIEAEHLLLQQHENNTRREQQHVLQHARRELHHDPGNTSTQHSIDEILGNGKDNGHASEEQLATEKGKSLLM